MFETIVGLFWTAALFYAAFGFVFAIPFVRHSGWVALIPRPSLEAGAFASQSSPVQSLSGR